MTFQKSILSTLNRAEASAAATRLSLSVWVSNLLKAQTPAIDANSYPIGFFEYFSANAHHWKDFPMADSIARNSVSEQATVD
jgi:hypothetical protein